MPRNMGTTAKIEEIESHDHHHQRQSGTTFLRTCFNGINALSGVGILSVPYALSQGGWLSIILLLTVAILCFYTGVLLQRCMLSNSLQSIETYPDIGGAAFGRRGRVAVSIFMYLELYLVAVEFLILEGDNLAKLFPDAGELLHAGGVNIRVEQGFIILTSLLVLPSTWLRNLGVLAYVSVGGVLASIILVFAVFWVGAFEGVGFHGGAGTRLWSWSGLPSALSLFTFCYCGHAVFPTLCNSMRDRTKFSKVLLICFSLSTATYGTMAIFGYSMYGEDLKSQVTLNLPIEKVGSLVAIYTTLINPLTKYALVVSPIAEALEAQFPSSRESRLISILIRTVLVLSTLIVALVIPFFGYVMAFTGAFLSVAASILLPCLCYLKIHWAQRFGLEAAFLVTILILGSLVVATGTYVSLRDIIGEFRKY